MRSPRVETFAGLPDPGQAGTLDDLVDRLRLLKVWAGEPSYEWIKDRVNAAWTAAGRPAGDLAGKTTVVDCFRRGRRRLNPDLVVAVVQALHPDVGYVAQWRQALQVIGMQTQAALQVRVQDVLPQDQAGFVGRTAELERLGHGRCRGECGGGAVAIAVIAGMAGVGKTRLAIHAGHLLTRERAFDRVLFVNLRGFHPDPAQPPADPAAVLDGFLRLLGVPGHQVPHDLSARTAAYRGRLGGTRALVVLDNAADEDQVRPLLPGMPGCLTLITSRRSLPALHAATHLAVNVFTHDEALEYLTFAVLDVPVGQDPRAATRIARRCGHLPLALRLVAAHIRGTPGWTLTDHADRLDERHRDRRLDNGVELALDLSYLHLPTDRRRLLRLAALHPGQDLDPHAAAALAGSDLVTARAQLDHLSRDHLLPEGSTGRYTFHDTVRAYAANRATDEDPPAERRAALTRLFDYYLATCAIAMDTLHPAETHRRPRIPPPGTPTPVLTDPDTAVVWLDTERPILVAVAAHTVAYGWPTHTTRLSTTLFRYLTGGHFNDALAIHGHARHAGCDTGDPSAQADALTSLGATNGLLGRYGSAADDLQQALILYRRARDPVGEARALTNLGAVEGRLGRYRQAADRLEHALTLFRQAGDHTGEPRALGYLGVLDGRLGRYRQAADHLEQALTLYRNAGDHSGEAWALNDLGNVERQLGWYELAAEHLEQALILYRQAGDHTGEAWTRNSLGTLRNHLDRPTEADEHYQQALAMFRAIGERYGEACVLNGFGESAHNAGRLADTLIHHTSALTIAADIGDRYQQARAHTGLGHAHHTLTNTARARRHYRHALTLYTDLGTPEADEMHARLTAIDDNNHLR